MKHADRTCPCGLRGLQLRAVPTASAASAMQRFGAFPRPGSLIPAIIATTGKGSFLGSCKTTEIYREEPGGITTPWPGRTRHRLGVGWVHLSHTLAASPPVPARRCEDREGDTKGSDVVAVPSATLRVLPRAPSLRGAGTAASLQGQSWQGGHRGRNGALGSKGQL